MPAYCRERFWPVLAPGAAAFRLQSADTRTQDQGNAEDCEHTCSGLVWSQAYPSEPFFLDVAGQRRASGRGESSESSLVESLAATAGRQSLSTFLRQVSGACFSNELFLSRAIERHDRFLRLMGGSSGSCCR